jgi:hypothetical protein
VVAGASAGAITGALGPVALAVPIKLPPVRDATDLAGTMTAIIAAAGEDAISPD